MSFQLPQVTHVNPDIKNLSIYLRSTKKWGKTTLFRDMILEKYGDPTYGLLVGCGHEKGYKLLDNLNATQISTYKEAVELKNWLIAEKGKSHNIEIVAFDTGDEFVLLCDKETIKIANIENPNKKVKSIKAAMGGFTAGEKYSANDIIKPYMGELMDAGFGVWVICHTKFKTIKEKGSLDEDGYMQLTSNLGSDYESAFGDIFDVVLTGVIDREFDEKVVSTPNGEKTKKYTTGTSRKLYFRETPLVDAGGRFADGAVPEYMVFEKGVNNAAEFVRIVEEGMEKSKLSATGNDKPAPKKQTSKPVEKAPEPVVEAEEEDDTTNDADEENLKNLRTKIRDMVRSNKSLAKEVKNITRQNGFAKIDDIDDVDVLNEILSLE